MPDVKNPPAQVKQLLNSPAVQSAIMRAKPSHVSVDKIVSAALTCVSLNPALAKNPTALLRTVVQSAQLGLELGGPMAEAHPVPFKNEITLIVGYQGLCKLARQSGEIANIESRAVYEADEIEVHYGTESYIKHVPKIDGPAGGFIGCYAVIHLKEPGTRPLIEFMTKEQVDAVKGSARSGPWSNHYSEMARKTVLRRVLKTAPRSVEMAWAMQVDDAAEAGESVVIGKEDVIDLGAAEEVSQADALEAELAGEEG